MDGICPKCQSAPTHTKYIPGTIGDVGPREHLLLECSCGFIWTEPCCDAAVRDKAHVRYGVVPASLAAYGKALEEASDLRAANACLEAEKAGHEGYCDVIHGRMNFLESQRDGLLKENERSREKIDTLNARINILELRWSSDDLERIDKEVEDGDGYSLTSPEDRP